MHNGAMRIILARMAVCSALAISLAWTTSGPTLMAGGANDQVQPKIGRTSDGGFCLAWFDNATGGYDVRANRFNASGQPAWGANGVLVADRSFSSTVDYGATVVSGDRFAVAYNDDRSGGDRISITLLASDGSALWTSTMVTGSDYVGNPKVCEDSVSGAIYAAWLQGTTTRVQRLDIATGAPVWSTAVNLTDGTAQTPPADLWPAADTSGGVMMSCVRQTGFTSAKLLRAFRVSPSGVVGWTAGSTLPINVMTSGSLQFGNYPACAAVPGVGYVFAWYTTSPLQCAVQVLGLDGAPRFPAGGVTVTSTANVERVSPAFAVSPQADRLFVAWSDHVPNSSVYGMGAQAFALSGNGARLWGESGFALQPQATLYSTDFVAVAADSGGANFHWQSSTAFGSDVMRARRLSPDAQDLFSAGTVQVAPSSDKGRMAAIMQQGASVVVWQDGATGATDVRGQRVANDGTVGGDPVRPGDADGNGTVDGSDLAALLAAWGTNDAATDFSGDGNVDGVDLTTLLANWG